MAVATRQKSTARRFVSILAVLEGTYLMLCTAGTAVTTRPVGAVPASAVLSDEGAFKHGACNYGAIKHGAYCRLI